MNLTSMTLSILLAINLVAFTGVPPPLHEEAFAQRRSSAETETAQGLHTVTFGSDRGKIRVNLPDDMSASDTISGTVMVEPEGKNEEQRRKNMDELNGYVIEMEKERTSVNRPFLKWAIPSTLTSGIVYLIFREKNGNEVSRTAVPVRPAPSAIDRPVIPTPADYQLPPIGQAGTPIRITGSFDGDFASTAVKMGGREINKLAESPRKLVVESPRDVVGPTKLEVVEGNVRATGQYRNVVVKITAGETNLRPNQQTVLRIEQSGLLGLEKPLNASLRNETPGIVRMDGGDEQVITTRPEDVEANGTRTLTSTLTGIRPGGFTINVSVISPLVLAPQYAADFCDRVCPGCAKDCRNLAEACGDEGNEQPVAGTEEKVGREVKTSTGEIWQKHQQKWRKCVKKECTCLTVYCCEYTKWEDLGFRYYWKVKRPADKDFHLPEDAIPCDCGTLIDILTLVGLTKFDQKQDMLEYLAKRHGCRLLTWKNAESMAKGCGLEELWKKSTELTGNDFVKWATEFLGSFQGPKK